MARDVENDMKKMGAT